MKFFSIPAIVAMLAFSTSQALSVDIPPAPAVPNQPAAATHNAIVPPLADSGAAMTAPTLQTNPQIPAAPGVVATTPNTNDPRPDQWRYKHKGNRWWYWTPQNRWMVYGQSGWVYPDATSGYTTYYNGPTVAPALVPADTGVNVVVPDTTYDYYGPGYGYYYPRRYYYGGPGVYIGGPRFGVRVGRWW
jgi:hypothetical protein